LTGEPSTTWPLPRFTANDSFAELHRWTDRTSTFDAKLAERVRTLIEQPARALADAPEPAHTIVHRDFHDKQVHVSNEGRPGLLDFDTLSTGDPALDVGNFLAHLELRRIQGRVSADDAAQACEAFLCAYAPDRDVHSRSRVYRSMTLLRLCCVYAFRTGGSEVSNALLHAANL